MKKSLIALGIVALFVVAVVQAQKTKTVVYVSAKDANFKPSATGGGVSMATLWGDPQKGAHADIHEIRARIRRGHAYAHERCVDQRYQRRLFV